MRGRRVGARASGLHPRTVDEAWQRLSSLGRHFLCEHVATCCNAAVTKPNRYRKYRFANLAQIIAGATGPVGGRMADLY